MSILINFFIFILVLFIYIHISYHIKVNDTLNINDITYETITKERLNEVTLMKQPTLFVYNYCEYDKLKKENLLLHNSKINIRKTTEYKEKDNTYLPIDLIDANKLFTNDVSGIYVSENNYEFIKDAGLEDIFISDYFLKPEFTVYSEYDILFGSINSYTPLRYDLSYKNYYYVVDGEIELVITNPKSKEYLNIITDYEHFEFRSEINIFDDVSLNSKYIKLNMKKGEAIYIPPRWFNSIKFIDSNSVVIKIQHTVLMNYLGILPEKIKYLMQLNNINYINNLQISG